TIKITRIVVLYASAQNLIFQNGSWNGIALDLCDHFNESLGALSIDANPMPHREKPSIGAVLHRLDLMPQLRERSLADDTKDVRIAPFLAFAAWTEFALEHFADTFQLPQHPLDDRQCESEPLSHIVRGKRTSRSRISCDQI